MDSKLKIMFGIIAVSIFIFLITVLVFVYALAPNPQDIPEFLLPFLSHHIEFMALMGIFGVLSGMLVYNLMSQTIEKQKKAAKTNFEILLKFLAKEDAEVLKLLRQKGGMTTQSEIAKEIGLTRLRAHRAVRRLEDRGIIHVEKHGKVNLLRLMDELKKE